jgi:hypothetical protein
MMSESYPTQSILLMSFLIQFLNTCFGVLNIKSLVKNTSKVFISLVSIDALLLK